MEAFQDNERLLRAEIKALEDRERLWKEERDVLLQREKVWTDTWQEREAFWLFWLNGLKSQHDEEIKDFQTRQEVLLKLLESEKQHLVIEIPDRAQMQAFLERERQWSEAQSENVRRWNDWKSQHDEQIQDFQTREEVLLKLLESEKQHLIIEIERTAEISIPPTENLQPSGEDRVNLPDFDHSTVVTFGDLPKELQSLFDPSVVEIVPLNLPRAQSEAGVRSETPRTKARRTKTKNVQKKQVNDSAKPPAEPQFTNSDPNTAEIEQNGDCSPKPAKNTSETQTEESLWAEEQKASTAETATQTKQSAEESQAAELYKRAQEELRVVAESAWAYCVQKENALQEERDRSKEDIHLLCEKLTGYEQTEVKLKSEQQQMERRAIEAETQLQRSQDDMAQMKKAFQDERAEVRATVEAMEEALANKSHKKRRGFFSKIFGKRK